MLNFYKLYVSFFLNQVLKQSLLQEDLKSAAAGEYKRQAADGPDLAGVSSVVTVARFYIFHMFVYSFDAVFKKLLMLIDLTLKHAKPCPLFRSSARTKSWRLSPLLQMLPSLSTRMRPMYKRQVASKYKSSKETWRRRPSSW